MSWDFPPLVVGGVSSSLAAGAFSSFFAGFAGAGAAGDFSSELTGVSVVLLVSSGAEAILTFLAGSVRLAYGFRKSGLGSVFRMSIS